MEPKAEYKYERIDQEQGDRQAAQALEDMAGRLRRGEVHATWLNTSTDIEDVWYETAGGSAASFLRKIEKLYLTVTSLDTGDGPG